MSVGRERLKSALENVVIHDSDEAAGSFAYYCETPPASFKSLGGSELVSVQLAPDDTGLGGIAVVERVDDLCVLLEIRLSADGCDFVGGQATQCGAGSASEGDLVAWCRKMGVAT